MTKVDASGMSYDNLAEEVLLQLGVAKLPLAVTFLAELFDNLQLNAPKTSAWHTLEDQVVNLKDQLKYSIFRIDALETDNANLRLQNSDLKTRLRFKEHGGVINWADMCGRNPHNKIQMIKEIRQLLNLGLKDAKDLVDANVKSVKVFPNEATSKEVYVPVKESL